VRQAIGSWQRCQAGGGGLGVEGRGGKQGMVDRVERHGVAGLRW
jgi:hypothetical protein